MTSTRNKINDDAVAVANRVRRFRARRAAGEIVLTISVDEVGMVELLVAAGLLPPGSDPTRDGISRATEKFLKMMIEGEVLR